MMSYSKIAQKLQKESPHLCVNSPQTARNLCQRALKKMRFIIMSNPQKKEELKSYYELLLKIQ